MSPTASRPLSCFDRLVLSALTRIRTLTSSRAREQGGLELVALISHSRGKSLDTKPTATPPSTSTGAQQAIATRTMVKVEARLAELGIELPDVIAPKGEFYAVRPFSFAAAVAAALSPNLACLSQLRLTHNPGNYALSVRTGNLLFLGKRRKTTSTGKQRLLPFF